MRRMQHLRCGAAHAGVMDSVIWNGWSPIRERRGDGAKLGISLSLSLFVFVLRAAQKKKRKEKSCDLSRPPQFASPREAFIFYYHFFPPPLGEDGPTRRADAKWEKHIAALIRAESTGWKRGKKERKIKEKETDFYFFKRWLLPVKASFIIFPFFSIPDVSISFCLKENKVCGGGGWNTHTHTHIRRAY